MYVTPYTVCRTLQQFETACSTAFWPMNLTSLRPTPPSCPSPIPPQINEMVASATAAKPSSDDKTAVSRPSGMRLLFTRRYLPQLVMATIIPAAQQLTGINSIM